MAMKTKTQSMRIPESTMKHVTEYAERYGLTKSAAVVLLLNKGLESEKALDSIDQLTKLWPEIKKTLDEGK